MICRDEVDRSPFAVMSEESVSAISLTVVCAPVSFEVMFYSLFMSYFPFGSVFTFLFVFFMLDTN